jgi:hypothetical protein
MLKSMLRQYQLILIIDSRKDKSLKMNYKAGATKSLFLRSLHNNHLTKIYCSKQKIIILKRLLIKNCSLKLTRKLNLFHQLITDINL